MSWKNYFQRNELLRLASHKGMISLRELRSASGMLSILDKVLKSEL
jgi:hypothetical protein